MGDALIPGRAGERDTGAFVQYGSLMVHVRSKSLLSQDPITVLTSSAALRYLRRVEADIIPARRRGIAVVGAMDRLRTVPSSRTILFRITAKQRSLYLVPVPFARGRMNLMGRSMLHRRDVTERSTGGS
jgi:hypothetical protein